MSLWLGRRPRWGGGGQLPMRALFGENICDSERIGSKDKRLNQIPIQVKILELGRNVESMKVHIVKFQFYLNELF